MTVLARSSTERECIIKQLKFDPAGAREVPRMASWGKTVEGNERERTRGLYEKEWGDSLSGPVRMPLPPSPWGRTTGGGSQNPTSCLSDPWVWKFGEHTLGRELPKRSRRWKKRAEWEGGGSPRTVWRTGTPEAEPSRRAVVRGGYERGF